MRRTLWVLPLAAIALISCGSDGNDGGAGGADSGGRDPNDNHLEPLSNPDCGNATELVTVSDAGMSFAVSETDNNQWFCFSDGTTIGLDSQPGTRTEASITDQISLPFGGVATLFVLPVDTPTATRVVDDTGADVAFAQAGDGDHLLLLDVAAPDMGPDMGEPTTFTMLDAQGNVLLELQGFR